MPEFLAETCAPRGAPGTPVPSAADLARAAGQASGPQGPVRFLGAIAVPEEETCFWLYQAPSAAAVRAAMTAAGLRPERITPAVPIRPPPPAPGPPAASRRPPHPDSVSTRPRPPRQPGRPAPPARIQDPPSMTSPGPAGPDPGLPALPTPYPVWSTTMPSTTRSQRSRPHGAPAYYLARPASVWITALLRQPPAAPERPAGSGTACQPERTIR